MTKDPRDALTLRALQAARQFIRNGVEFGYIRMPDADCPDSAHETPGQIDAALAALAAADAPEGQQAGTKTEPAALINEYRGAVLAWNESPWENDIRERYRNASAALYAALAAQAEGQQAAALVEVTQEDANNYCRILTLLGMEEEGDPVAEVARLLAAAAPEGEQR